MINQASVSVETMVRKRRRILLGSLVTWGIWQGTRIVGDFTIHGTHPISEWSAVLRDVWILSWLAWVVSLVYLSLFIKKIRRNPALAMVLGDELFLQTRLKAAAFAFSATLLCQAIIPLILIAHPFSAEVGVDVTIFVGVTTFLGAFLVLERD